MPQAFFYPWNPLSLSKDIDSGIRVDRGKVQIPLFANKKHRLVWNPAIHDNFVMFTHSQEDVVDICEKVAKVLKKRETAHSGQARLYDFHDSMQWADNFANPDFARVPYKHDFSQFMQDYIILRNEINKKSLAAGMVEPSNKQLQILIIPMGEREINMFQTSPVIQKSFIDILRNSRTARMFPWFVMSDASMFSDTFCRMFGMSIYMGAENSQFAHDVVYPELPLSGYSAYHKVLGVALAPHGKQLMRLQPMGRGHYSEWGKQMKEYSKNEEAAYRAYLDSLKD